MKPSIVILCAAAALGAACTLVPADPAQAQGLSANPHSREGCLQCHLTVPNKPSPGTVIITPLAGGPHEVIAQSCRTCHKEGKDNFWIIMMPEGGAAPRTVPPAASSTVAVPAAADQGFANSHDTMECATCHDGNPGSIKGRLAAPFPYGDQGVGAYCRGCHETVDGSHYPRNNRPRGAVSCLNCHQVHGSSFLFPALKAEYTLFVIESRDINPHGGRLFCLTCHRDEPLPGSAPSFRSEGDGTALCQRCHDEVEHHPLGIKSSPGTWKMDFSDFPLQEEAITCVTCHDPPSCENTVSRDNPRFLRGGPYNTVEDFCDRCHEGRSFVSINPHDQIDDAGNVGRKQCLYCHTTIPEEGFTLGPEDFTDDLMALCVSCHIVAPHPDIDHMLPVPSGMDTDIREYEERRLVKLPLDAGGQVTCVTCHNPHERGLLRGPAGVGADEEKRLRLATFNEICTPCHGRH